MISNCGTPTERVSKFLDHHLKPVIKSGKSYIKDSGHFLKKIKNLECIPDNTLLVTADVVRLYPNISHQASINALKKALDKRPLEKIPTDDLIKMAEFVLSNNFFKFNSDILQQISGTVIFRTQAYDSIMHGYFCIGFINFMLASKTSTDFTK